MDSLLHLQLSTLGGGGKADWVIAILRHSKYPLGDVSLSTDIKRVYSADFQEWGRVGWR